MTDSKKFAECGLDELQVIKVKGNPRGDSQHLRDEPGPKLTGLSLLDDAELLEATIIAPVNCCHAQPVHKEMRCITIVATVVRPCSESIKHR